MKIYDSSERLSLREALLCSPRNRMNSVSWLMFALLLVPGCKSMTEAKLDQLTKDLEAKRATLVQQEKALQEADEARAKVETTRKVRQEKLRIAGEKLASGDAKSALVEVEELLAPTRKSQKDPTTGRIETKVETPPDMEFAEHASLLSLQGAVLTELGRPEEAQTAFREALKLDPSNHLARRSLGRFLGEAKQHKSALQVLLPELADGRRDAELLGMVGRTRYELGRADGNASQIEAARIAFEQVLVEKPEDQEIVRLLAEISFESEKFADAQRYYELLRRQSPLNGIDLERLGQCALALGDKRKALDYFELAAGVTAASKELCMAISSLSAALNFPSRAAEWLAQAHKNEPSNASPEARLQVGSLFLDAARAEDALPWLTAVGPSDPSYEEAQGLLVKVHSMAGRADEAALAYEKTKKVAPNDPSIHLIAGSMYLRRGNFESAVAAYMKASGTPKLKADGLSGLAEVALAKGDLEDAARHYREALAARPGDAGFMASLAQIEDERMLSEAGKRSSITTAQPNAPRVR